MTVSSLLSRFGCRWKHSPGLPAKVSRQKEGSGSDRPHREAALTRLAVRHHAELGKRFLGRVVLHADLVDVARLGSRGDVAADLARDAHHLLDLLHRAHALALAPPDVVLDA